MHILGRRRSHGASRLTLIPGCGPGGEGNHLPGDLAGLPLITPRQGWEGDIRQWAGDRFGQLRLDGSFRLAYNASMFAREGLGYQLSFRHLVDTSPESGLVFRPLSPPLETTLYLIWNRYQTLTPMAQRFLDQIRESFGERSG